MNRNIIVLAVIIPICALGALFVYLNDNARSDLQLDFQPLQPADLVADRKEERADDEVVTDKVTGTRLNTETKTKSTGAKAKATEVGENSDTEGKNTQDSDTGGENTQDSDTGGKDTQDSDTGGKNTQDSDTEGENTQDSDIGGENTQDSDTEGENTQDSDAEGENTQDSDTGGENTQDSDTGGENTQDSDTEGKNTQDSDTGGENTQDSDIEQFDVSGAIQPGRISEKLDQSGNSRDKDECSFKERRQQMRRICSGIPREQLNVFLETGARLHNIIINPARKIFYCRIDKSGSVSALTYFGNINRMLGEDRLAIFKNGANGTAGLSNDGFSFIKDLSVREALVRYHDFRKILFVRHPLQRIVSSFYHTCFGTQHNFARGITNLTGFFQLVLGYKGLAPCYWRDYQHACHPCLFDYDYIVKTEYIESDVPLMGKALKVPVITFPHKHIGVGPGVEEQDGMMTRYDPVLTDTLKTEPALFRRVLQNLTLDMEMFGYQWKKSRSLCSLNDDMPCC